MHGVKLNLLKSGINYTFHLNSILKNKNILIKNLYKSSQ